MTELREPKKVFDRANGKPMAIFKNSAHAGHLVPAEHLGKNETGVASKGEVKESWKRVRSQVPPLFEYLKVN